MNRNLRSGHFRQREQLVQRHRSRDMLGNGTIVKDVWAEVWGMQRDEAKKVSWAVHENDQAHKHLSVMYNAAGIKE